MRCRIFMSLGGARGVWGVGEGPFLRRLPHLALFTVGTTRLAVGRFRHEPASAGGGLPDHSGTKQPQRFGNCVIVTNAIYRIVVGENSHSDNLL